MLDEWAPILPETLSILGELAVGLSDDSNIFVGDRLSRLEPLGPTGLARLVDQLVSRSDLQGCTGHGLRRTFA
jgi:hypothetical protein